MQCGDIQSCKIVSMVTYSHVPSCTAEMRTSSAWFLYHLLRRRKHSHTVLVRYFICLSATYTLNLSWPLKGSSSPTLTDTYFAASSTARNGFWLPPEYDMVQNIESTTSAHALSHHMLLFVARQTAQWAMALLQPHAVYSVR